jgi:hypothetical protein
MCFYGLGGVGMPEWWERALVQVCEGTEEGKVEAAVRDLAWCVMRRMK